MWKWKGIIESFLAVQWLRHHTFTTVDAGSIPGWGTKICMAKIKDNKRKEIAIKSCLSKTNKTSYSFLRVFNVPRVHK